MIPQRYDLDCITGLIEKQGLNLLLKKAKKNINLLNMSSLTHQKLQK